MPPGNSEGGRGADEAPLNLGSRGPMLRFKLSQNESVAYDSREFVMPISNRGIAGSAVLAKKAINVPEDPKAVQECRRESDDTPDS